jgi:pimeloyl-ACP methyl ester carboxylesterase
VVLRIVLVALVFSILLVLPLFGPQFESPQVLTEQRQQQSADTVESTNGSTRFESWGDRRKPTVILIHSFNGFLETWQPNVEALVKSGYHVVAYDLFGRGLSDRPLRPLSLNVFHEQIIALRKHLDIQTPVHLVGASFGSVIAADYALTYPDQVHSLILTGPAGWPNSDDSTAKLVSLPYAADMLFFYAGKFILQSKIQSYLLNDEEAKWANAYWKVYNQFPGVARSALSTLRHSPVLDYRYGWRKLGKTKLPTLLIWGRQDSSYPYSQAREAQNLIPQAKIIALDSAEHWVNIDQADEVNSTMIGFLNGLR